MFAFDFSCFFPPFIILILKYVYCYVKALQKEGHDPDEYYFEVDEVMPTKKPSKRTNSMFLHFIVLSPNWYYEFDLIELFL